MNKDQLLAKFAAKMQSIDLEAYGVTSEDKLFIKPLSALERAQFLDKYNGLTKQADNENTQIEKLVKDVQSFAMVKSLVDETGARLFSDDDIEAASVIFPCDAFDFIQSKIMKLNAIDAGESLKNSKPIGSDVSN